MKIFLSPIHATLVPGGVEHEVVVVTLRVLKALGDPFDWDVQQAGGWRVLTVQAIRYMRKRWRASEEQGWLSKAN